MIARWVPRLGSGVGRSTGLSFHPGNAAWAVLPCGSALQLGCGHELPLTRPGRLAATRGGVGVLARRTVPAAERARHHPVPGQRRNQGILIGIVIAVVFAIAGLVIFSIVAKSTGAGGFTWGLVFAFVPVIPVIALYLWLDRYEPEPTKYILFALCWGAFIATLVAIFINTKVSSCWRRPAAAASGRPCSSRHRWRSSRRGS